jgi:hypothetical protein
MSILCKALILYLNLPGFRGHHLTIALKIADIGIRNQTLAAFSAFSFSTTCKTVWMLLLTSSRPEPISNNSPAKALRSFES